MIIFGLPGQICTDSFAFCSHRSFLYTLTLQSRLVLCPWFAGSRELLYIYICPSGQNISEFCFPALEGAFYIHLFRPELSTTSGVCIYTRLMGKVDAVGLSVSPVYLYVFLPYPAVHPSSVGHFCFADYTLLVYVCLFLQNIYIYSKHAIRFFLHGHFVFLCLIIRIVKTLTKVDSDCNNHKYSPWIQF